MKQSSILQGVAQKGSVLQVVSTTKTDTFSASVGAGAISGTVTGLTAVITPSSSSNKVLVRFAISLDCSTAGVFVILEKGGSPLGVGDASGSRKQATSAGSTSTTGTFAGEFEDSPATTSELTYSFKLAHTSVNTQTVLVNRSIADGNAYTAGRFVSTITLMEVAG